MLERQQTEPKGKPGTERLENGYEQFFLESQIDGYNNTIYLTREREPVEQKRFLTKRLSCRQVKSIEHDITCARLKFGCQLV